MERDEAFTWLIQSGRRTQLMLCLSQPMTAKQMAGQTGIADGDVSKVLTGMELNGLLRCMNPSARRSRLFALTPLGMACRNRLCHERGIDPNGFELDGDIDWPLYGAVCFSHRATVIRSIDGPMQSAQIKRRARYLFPGVRMSANNVRDVMGFFLESGVVQRVESRQAHPLYELTKQGCVFQELLLRAEGRGQIREVEQIGN